MPPRRLRRPPTEPGWYITLPVGAGILFAPVRCFVRGDDADRLRVRPCRVASRDSCRRSPLADDAPVGALSVSYVRHDSGAPVHCEVDLLWREDPLVYRVWQDQDLASLAEGTVLDHFQVTRGAGGLHATSPGMVAVEHLGRVRVAVNRWLSDVERYVRVVQVR